MLALQKSRLEQVSEEVSESLDHLERNCAMPLRDIDRDDDEIMVFMYDEIDRLNADLLDFNPSINLQGTSLTCELETTAQTIGKIERVIVDSASVI